MKKVQFVFLAFLLITSPSFSQIVFEKGYFIDESNQKIECLIKNVGWRNNPTQFSYKLSPDEEVKTGSLENVIEFGVTNTLRYVRANVKIDRSSSQTRDLTNYRSPKFNEELLFLKVLIDGEASLYHFVDGNLVRFFYNSNDSVITQLVYKKFEKDQQSIGTNNFFRQQLFNDLNCEKNDSEYFERVTYSKKELEKVFVAYNNCKTGTFKRYDTSHKKNQFNLTLRPGLRSSSLSIQNSISRRRNTDFDNKLSFQLGFEAEFMLSFNRNKWSIIIEPTYQQYKSEKEITTETVTVDYESIELPIGVRHYFFLSEKSKVFLNGLYVLDFDLNSTINFVSNSTDNLLEITSSPNLAFGIGYKQNNKYSLEMRYQIPNRGILNQFTFWRSEYQVISFILGYSIFGT